MHTQQLVQLLPYASCKVFSQQYLDPQDLNNGPQAPHDHPHVLTGPFRFLKKSIYQSWPYLLQQSYHGFWLYERQQNIHC